MQECSQEDKILQEQYKNLVNEKLQENKRNELTYKNVSIWNQANYKLNKTTEINKHNFNLYADKLLIHLVVEVKFDFEKIAQIMSYAFKHQLNHYTQKACRQRWYELHRDRDLIPQIKEKQMQDKRVKSIMSMTDPFLLYNVDQKLHKMHKQQLEQKSESSYTQYKYEGYNIFKDSIRKIDDMQKHNELQKHMRQALKKASRQVQLQKPMLYTPYYDKLEYFEVQQQELTLQKMQKMMSHPIQMQLMERQLKALDLSQNNFESNIKKDAQKIVKQNKIKNQEEFQIKQDWDQYQSD